MAKHVLRFGVALLGLRITFEEIAALGLIPVLIVIGAVALTLLSGLGIARVFNRGWRFGLLTGGAVAICGASAALAIASDLPRGSETVLLVEDEVLVRDMVNRVLSQQGYLVLEAPNGVEALKLAQERADESIHLLLADLVMPLLGGKELGDKLARIHPETKVLFTSGYTDQTIAHHGMLEPDTNFIQKPYSLAALVKKVRAVLNTESC